MNRLDSLYWEEGQPHACIIPFDRSFSQTEMNEAITHITDFISKCHEIYSLLCVIESGIPMWLSTAGTEDHLKQNPDNHFLFGSYLPSNDRPPSQGKSIHSIVQNRRLLEILQRNECDDIIGKMILVYMYHVWDEDYRVRIKKSLSLSDKKPIKCTLMGDMGKVRHAILHRKSDITEYIGSFEFLPNIWSIEPGTLIVTSAMLSSFMEQLNALRVKVCTSQQ